MRSADDRRAQRPSGAHYAQVPDLYNCSGALDLVAFEACRQADASVDADRETVRAYLYYIRKKAAERGIKIVGEIELLYKGRRYI